MCLTCYYTTAERIYMSSLKIRIMGSAWKFTNKHRPLLQGTRKAEFEAMLVDFALRECKKEKRLANSKNLNR